jgi:hypothetical protein
LEDVEDVVVKAQEVGVVGHGGGEGVEGMVGEQGGRESGDLAGGDFLLGVL